MARLIEALARNPEALAIGAICVVLGAGQNPVPRMLAPRPPIRITVPRIWMEPPSAAFRSIREAMREIDSARLGL